MVMGFDAILLPIAGAILRHWIDFSAPTRAGKQVGIRSNVTHILKWPVTSSLGIMKRWHEIDFCITRHFGWMLHLTRMWTVDIFFILAWIYLLKTTRVSYNLRYHRASMVHTMPLQWCIRLTVGVLMTKLNKLCTASLYLFIKLYTDHRFFLWSLKAMVINRIWIQMS